jgi:hypothetical protein
MAPRLEPGLLVLAMLLLVGCGDAPPPRPGDPIIAPATGPLIRVVPAIAVPVAPVVIEAAPPPNPAPTRTPAHHRPHRPTGAKPPAAVCTPAAKAPVAPPCDKPQAPAAPRPAPPAATTPATPLTPPASSPMSLSPPSPPPPPEPPEPGAGGRSSI